MKSSKPRSSRSHRSETTSSRRDTRPSGKSSTAKPKKESAFGKRWESKFGKSWKPEKPEKSEERGGGRFGGKGKRFGKGGEDERKKHVKRPRIKRGPWGSSAYLPTLQPGEAAVTPRKKKTVKASDEPLGMESQGMPEASSEGLERLQKVLARCGVASRRAAEELILEGAVTVNGRTVTELGIKVNAERDKIKVHGKLIYTEVEPMYLALYKPKGVISSLADPEGRKHLGMLLRGVRERVVPIGRLDYNSEGLILLTNDGALGERIQKARDLPKLYMVKIKGHPTTDDLEFFKRGIFSAEGVVRVASYGVEQTLKNKSWLKLEVIEGSRLDLRELLNHRGLLVDRIVRTAIGSISIHGMHPGEYRLLKRQDFERLLTFKNS